MSKVCAFTGHRVLAGTDFDVMLLEKVIEDLIKNGYTRFLCGMAVGFDLQAAQCVCALKEKYDVSLVACIPCNSQSQKYSKSNKLLYDMILERCDEVITLSEDYIAGCMQVRDRYMVDNCDALVCFLRKKRGGTYYTVSYAKKQNKKIIEL